MEISCIAVPTGRRILLILQATAGTDVHIDEEMEGFVIVEKK